MRRLYRPDGEDGDHEDRIDEQATETAEPLSADQGLAIRDGFGRQGQKGRGGEGQGDGDDPDDDPVHGCRQEQHTHADIGDHKGGRSHAAWQGEGETLTGREPQGQDIGQGNQRSHGRGPDEPARGTEGEGVGHPCEAVADAHHETEQGDWGATQAKAVGPDRQQRSGDDSCQHGGRQHNADLGAA